MTKRAFKRLAERGTSELKAARSSEKTILALLESLAREDVSIVVVALDKQPIRKPPKDPESLYRQTVAVSVRECVERWNRLEVTLDKRYTQRYL